MSPTPEPATPDMAPVAAALIYLTMGKVADYLFGSGDAKHARDVLSRLFRARNNRFSHQFAEVVTSPAEVTGLVIAYAGRTMRSLEIPTAWHLARVSGVIGFVRFLSRALPISRVKEAEADEYFISHLAVLPACQGQGLGTHLLSQVEKTAGEMGLSKVSLVVDRDNERALSLYRRVGFAIEETVSVEPLRKRIGYGGYYRMVKALG